MHQAAIKGLGFIGEKLKQEPSGKKTTRNEQKEKRNRQSQTPPTRRPSSPSKRHYRSRGEDTRNIITQARVNRSHYEWDEGNYEDDKKEMGALCFTRRVRRMRYPKDSSYLMTSKNMMDHKNPNYGNQTIFKPLKYSGSQGQPQCKACNYTSPVQHGLG
jgi:hypothetical protein